MIAGLTLVQCQCGHKNDATDEVNAEEIIPAAEDTLAVESTENKAEYNEAELKAMVGATAPVFAFNNESGDANLFLKYVMNEIKYPAAAKEKKIEGQVVVSFLVDKTGKVSDAQVLKSADPLLDAEALRAVQSSPDWTPATDNQANPIAVRYNLPVNFQLK